MREVRRYLWNVESTEGEDNKADLASKGAILYSPRYAKESLDAAIGVLIDRFGFYIKRDPNR